MDFWARCPASSAQGIFFASWDLRDHLFIHDETRWFDMHRFSETLWMLQRSHRTSYSNRLLPDQWDALFERNGLRALHSVAEQSPIAQRGLRERAGIEISDALPQDPSARWKPPAHLIEVGLMRIAHVITGLSDGGAEGCFTVSV